MVDFLIHFRNALRYPSQKEIRNAEEGINKIQQIAQELFFLIVDLENFEYWLKGVLGDCLTLYNVYLKQIKK